MSHPGTLKLVDKVTQGYDADVHEWSYSIAERVKVSYFVMLISDIDALHNYRIVQKIRS